MTIGAPDWTLWAGTVGFDKPVPDRLAAASAAGCGWTSVGPLDLLEVDDPRVRARRIGALAREAGLRLAYDPMMNWYPSEGGIATPFATFSAEQGLELAAEMGATRMSAMGQLRAEFGDPTTGRDVAAVVDADLLAEHFASLCDTAAGLGIAVELEFIPMTDVRDLATAWHCVRTADRPNGSLIIDCWHFFHCAATLDSLRAIPGDRIGCVQFNDVGPDDASSTLFQQVRRRRLPGDGVGDLTSLVRTLAEIGGLGSIGPEVVNPELAAMPAEQAARLACERTAAALTDAGVAVAGQP